MTPEETARLFAYDSWANDLLLEALSVLRPEELSRDLGASHQSLLGTFAHLVAAEEIWLSRWKGAPRNGLASIEEVGSLDALRAFWEAVRDERDAFVAGLDESALSAVHEMATTSGVNYRHSLADMMRHLINHSTYHRGQLAAMVRQLGRRPPATDLIRFYREGA